MAHPMKQGTGKYLKYMGKYSRLGKNTLLVFIGNAGAKLIGLLMLPFYTRWFSVEDYGTTDIITVYVTFLMYIVTCSLAEAIFVFPKGVEREKQKSYFSSGVAFLCFSFCLTALLFALAEWLFAYYGIENSFTKNTWLVYGMLVGMSLQQFAQQFTRSIDKMVVYSVTGVVLTGFTALLAFMLIPHWGVKGYVWSIIGANLLAALYSVLCSKGYTFFSFRSVSGHSCKEMLKYTVPLIPNGIMWWLVNAFNRPLMESHLGMHAIGIFAVSNKFPGILSMLFTVFVSSWQISVLEEFGKKGYSEFFNRVFRLVVTGLFVIFVGITLCSKLLVTLFATEEFYDAWRYIPILTLGAMFSCISGFAGSNFSATRESKYFFYSSVWGAVTAVVFNFALIPLLGIWGVALSILLSFVVMAFARIAYGWKYVHITHIGKYGYILGLGALLIVSANMISCIWINISVALGVLLIILFINRDLLWMIKDKLVKYRLYR